MVAPDTREGTPWIRLRLSGNLELNQLCAGEPFRKHVAQLLDRLLATGPLGRQRHGDKDGSSVLVVLRLFNDYWHMHGTTPKSFIRPTLLFYQRMAIQGSHCPTAPLIRGQKSRHSSTKTGGKPVSLARKRLMPPSPPKPSSTRAAVRTSSTNRSSATVRRRSITATTRRGRARADRTSSRISLRSLRATVATGQDRLVRKGERIRVNEPPAAGLLLHEPGVFHHLRPAAGFRKFNRPSKNPS